MCALQKASLRRAYSDTTAARLQVLISHWCTMIGHANQHTAYSQLLLVNCQVYLIIKYYIWFSFNQFLKTMALVHCCCYAKKKLASSFVPFYTYFYSFNFYCYPIFSQIWNTNPTLPYSLTGTTPFTSNAPNTRSMKTNTWFLWYKWSQTQHYWVAWRPYDPCGCTLVPVLCYIMVCLHYIKISWKKLPIEMH